MEQDRKLEFINVAIQKLIRDNRNKRTTHDHDSSHTLQLQTSNDDDAEYQLALSQLLSASVFQLELLKGEEMLKQSKSSNPSEDVVASAILKMKSENVDASEGAGGCRESGTDEIVKELKKVKRQNFVTHCLLSVMIVLSVAWRLSEVTLILKVKDRLSHPFRSFGSMLKGMVKVPDKNGQEADNKEPQSEPSALPSLMIPEIPSMDAPNLGLHSEKQ